jgi:myo-inositol-1(or 4)-monophosphatase
MDLAEYHAFIRVLAEESGKIIVPHFGDARLSVDSKEDDSPVTVADRGAEERLRELIRKRYPSHGVIGEEFGSEHADAEYVWVLDPIDGTKSFISGCPLFGTLICLLYRGQPILGAIHQPVVRQLCIGDGYATTLNDKPVRVRLSVSVEASTLLYTDRKFIAEHQNLKAFEALEARAKIVRTWGDCYGYLLLAAGFADIMIDPVMKPWDLLPLVPIVRGAGGVITDWQGNDAVSGQSIVAALPGLHADVIRTLNP